MIKDSKALVIEHFRSAKEKMEVEFSIGNYNKGLIEAEWAARIATMHPILPSYIDEDIESGLSVEFNKRFGKIEYEPIVNRVLFYNSQIANRNALTQQYLYYLISRKFEVLFIVPYENNTTRGNDITDAIEASPLMEMYIPSGKDSVSRMKNICAKIHEFKPGKSFLHLTPYDSLGYSIFSNLASCIKYYIVHNDHTFWLGKGCTDYFLEFRNFGVSIALQRRKIEESRIIKCPYYPIIEERTFLGFPFNREGKVVGVLAANPYKFMMDGKHVLLDALKELLDLNPQFVMVVAGAFSGGLHKYIIDNNLVGRMVELGHRDDFFSLMKNVDIYVNSYPLIGGLTTQFAMEAGLPIVSYTKPELQSTNWAEGLIKKSEYQLTFTDISEFKNQLNNLIKNPELRTAYKDKNRFATFSKSDFERQVDEILRQPDSMTISEIPPTLVHDDEVFLNYYLQRNHNLKELRKRLFQKHQVQKVFGEGPVLLKNKLVKILKRILGSTKQ